MMNRLDFAEQRYESIAVAGELDGRGSFAADCALASLLVDTVELSDPNTISETIREEVVKSVGEHAVATRVLAVSYLTAVAKEQSVARLVANSSTALQKLNRPRWYKPRVSMQKIDREIALRKEVNGLMALRIACIDATIECLNESTMLDTESIS